MTVARHNIGTLGVDWFRIFADLRRGRGDDPRRRETFRSIGKQLGVSKGTVWAWASGQEPRHDDGERVIALWMECTGSARDAVPMRRR